MTKSKISECQDCRSQYQTKSCRPRHLGNSKQNLANAQVVTGGVSTRKVTLITEELCETPFSKSTVSEQCKNLDPVVESWSHRFLNDNRFPLVDDAMRLNQEIRCRERIIRIFPDCESLVRLIGALLIEFDKNWASNRRYLDMAELDTCQKDRPKDAKKVTRID